MSIVNGTYVPPNRLTETSPKPSKPRKPGPRGTPTITPQRARHYLTLAMGVFIPLLSLTLSHIGGTLLMRGDAVWLGLAAFVLMGCVLWVSLSHLAWSIQDITKSTTELSWLLGIACDLALVLGELTHVNASEAGLDGLVWGLMACVCCLSMLLNCWAFLKHPSAARKAAN